MFERILNHFMNRFGCGRRFAKFLVLGLVVDAAMIVAVISLVTSGVCN